MRFATYTLGSHKQCKSIQLCDCVLSCIQSFTAIAAKQGQSFPKFSCESHGGFTPNLLWFGRELRSMIGELVPCVEDRNTETYAEYALRSKKFLELAYAAARETSKKSAERTKTYHDRNLREFVYEPGDKVWVEDHSPKARGTRKLVQQYDGPWYILDKLGDVNYRMSLGPGCPIRVLHHNRLRPYET